MKPIERAIAIAVEAHAGQVDKAGAPYVLHPLRMMLRMDTEAEMMAAVLHDVVEDGPGWTFKRLAAEGIPGDVVEALECLTKRPEEKKDYEAFIRRAALNPLARRVKVADLEDNMDLRRIAHPTADDFTRIEKYRRAHAFLTEKPSPGSVPKDPGSSILVGGMTAAEFKAFGDKLMGGFVSNLNSGALATHPPKKDKD